jgi:hypothetical protein
MKHVCDIGSTLAISLRLMWRRELKGYEDLIPFVLLRVLTTLGPRSLRALSCDLRQQQYTVHSEIVSTDSMRRLTIAHYCIMSGKQ